MIIVAKDYIRVRQQTFSLNEPESHTPRALVPIVADNLEVRNLTRVGHMVAGAGADVVVAYTHQAQGLRGIGWQLAQIHLRGYMVAVHILHRHIKVAVNHLVHFVFDGLHLLLGGSLRQQIVALALLLFDMSVPRPRAAEHPHHSLIQNMLRRMHRRVLLLVMSIKLMTLLWLGKTNGICFALAFCKVVLVKNRFLFHDGQYLIIGYLRQYAKDYE